MRSIRDWIATILLCGILGPSAEARAESPPEVRGTWVTTTANDAISSPARSAETMKRLREIGLNTVYVEVWKNGYTQFPSMTLKQTIGVDRRPALMPQDPSDKPENLNREGRDLLQETLLEAHRNGLVYIAWFEYGFMAAHKSTDNHLRRMKPEWLSRDIQGNEIAKNGFVWMNPLHPDARRFLLDLVIEAIDKYDLDGVQLDDRIVWPYFDMGYDDYTRKVYAAEHQGRQPPQDPKDKEWTRWRIDKVNEYAKMFVQEVRARRPQVIISLSPAVYPWCLENYLLEWPKWAAWTSSDALSHQPAGWPGEGVTPKWDEFIPQVYRTSYRAFAQTWDEQVKYMKQLGGGRVSDLIGGIRVVGDGPDSTWEDLKKSIELIRSTGGGGHVLWFSRGALDLFPKELTAFYNVEQKGWVANPHFRADWRPKAIALTRDGDQWAGTAQPGSYQVIAKKNGVWMVVSDLTVPRASGSESRATIPNDNFDAVELLVDRRREAARR